MSLGTGSGSDLWNFRSPELSLSLPGAKVPESESSWNFRSRERKFLGGKVPVTLAVK